MPRAFSHSVESSYTPPLPSVNFAMSIFIARRLRNSHALCVPGTYSDVSVLLIFFLQMRSIHRTFFQEKLRSVAQIVI